MPLIKHFVLIFVLSFALGGCKTFKKLGEIETAVKNLTHHDSVNVSIHTSTSDDTGITVTLYNYHVERFTITELKNEATSIDSTI